MRKKVSKIVLKTAVVLTAGSLLISAAVPAAADEVSEDQAAVGDDSDFAASWDDILYESQEDIYQEEWEAEYGEDYYQQFIVGDSELEGSEVEGTDEVPLSPEEAAMLEQEAAAADGELMNASDLIAQSGGEDENTGDILDGMEPGPTALDLEALAQERAEAFLTAPYVVLEPADPQRIGKTMEELTRVPSPTGSDGELEIAQYIMDTMEELGYHVTSQNFHEDFLNEDLVDVPGMNILAEREVNAPDPTDDVLLVITHYDSKTSPEEGDAFANDKTGVAALLEAARLVSAETSVTDVCFVFLSGEEDGFYGSPSFLESIEQFLDKIIGVICVGPNGYSQKLVIPAGEKQEVIETIYSTVLDTKDGTRNGPAEMLMTSAAVQKLTLLSGMEILEETDDAGLPDTEGDDAWSENIGSWDWKVGRDLQSSCTAFEQAGLDTAYVHQQISGTSHAGQGEENVLIEADMRGVAQTADIVARTVGMYMAGMR